MALQFFSKSNNYSTEKLFDSIKFYEANISHIQALLKKGADIDVRDSKGRTPLLLACSHRKERIVALLIESGANVECCDENKCTALHYASENGWIEIVETLVQRGSDFDTRDIRGETPMHCASSSGHLNVVKCLAMNGAEIDPKNIADYTPLICAAQYSRKDIFNLLLKYNAKVDGNEGLLLYYSIQSNWSEIVQSLVMRVRVPDLNGKYLTSQTNLDESLRHLKVVKFLMRERTDINRWNEIIGRAALFDASILGHLEVVKWLVERVPDLNARDCYGHTALQLASAGGNLEIVQCLVEKEADINARDGIGRVALHAAASRGYLEVVKCLVEKGADINERSLDGDTPLMCAAQNNHNNVVDLLMDLGANVNGSNFNLYRFTMLHFASFNGRIDLVQSLVKRGCDLDARAIFGITPLYCACLEGKLDVVQSLLQAGASWDIADLDGNLPLNIIIVQEKIEFKLIELFINNGAYLDPIDYYRLIQSSSLEVLQHVKLSSQAIINKFNNRILPKLYKLPASGSLPRIEEMKIVSGSEVAQTIEQTVEFEIQTKGYCNILEARPMALSVFSVASILEYYKKKTLELKRPSAFDSANNNQHPSKSMRLS